MTNCQAPTAGFKNHTFISMRNQMIPCHWTWQDSNLDAGTHGHIRGCGSGRFGFKLYFSCTVSDYTKHRKCTILKAH